MTGFQMLIILDVLVASLTVTAFFVFLLPGPAHSWRSALITIVAGTGILFDLDDVAIVAVGAGMLTLALSIRPHHWTAELQKAGFLVRTVVLHSQICLAEWNTILAFALILICGRRFGLCCHVLPGIITIVIRGFSSAVAGFVLLGFATLIGFRLSTAGIEINVGTDALIVKELVIRVDVMGRIHQHFFDVSLRQEALKTVECPGTGVRIVLGGRTQQRKDRQALP